MVSEKIMNTKLSVFCFWDQINPPVVLKLEELYCDVVWGSGPHIEFLVIQLSELAEHGGSLVSVFGHGT